MELVRFNGSSKAIKNKLVALSFDDGPNPQNIFKILKILREYKSRATFFWIVENVIDLSNNKELFQTVISTLHKDGHEIGLHAISDYIPTLKSRFWTKFNKEELGSAKKTLEELTGFKIKVFRPHYLFQSASILIAHQLGLITVFGDMIHYADQTWPKDFQINRFSGANSGSILIFHDGVTMLRHETKILEVLPAVLRNLRQKSMRLITVSEIL